MPACLWRGPEVTRKGSGRSRLLPRATNNPAAGHVFQETSALMKFSRLLQYLTPHRPVLLAMTLLLLASSALALAQPWLAGQLTGVLLDPATAHWPMQQILLAWLALLVSRCLLGFGSQYCIGSTGEALAARLRSRLHAHLQALPLRYHQQHRRGDLLAILSNDAEIISGFVTNTLIQLLPLLLTFIGAVVMMTVIDPLIAGLALLLVPAYYLVVKIIGRGIRPISRAWVEAYSNLFTFIDENLSMLPAIKAFNREGEESARFAGHNSKLLSLSRRQLLAQSLLEPAVGPDGRAGAAAVALAGQYANRLGRVGARGVG